jgi:hypothetical protein
MPEASPSAVTACFTSPTRKRCSRPRSPARSIGVCDSGSFRSVPGLLAGSLRRPPDGIWLGTYEDSPGRLFRFTAATLARLSDGQTLEASQAATVLTIPDHAQGAEIGGGELWIARSDWNWGTLERLDSVTGAPERRCEIAPGTEGIAFGNAGRLWAVSEAGSRHVYDGPFVALFQPFFPLVFALDLSRLE